MISCGKGNDYGHPHVETMTELKAKGVIVYRTDESGTIVCMIDGKTLSFNVKLGDYQSGDGVSPSGSAAVKNAKAKPFAAQNIYHEVR